MTNQISVSRALSKSKSLLEDAINNAHNVKFAFVEVTNKTLDGKIIKNEKENVQKVFQSVNDKINESFRLRQGINAVNAVTQIDVGNGQMTIQDALAYKLYIIPAKKNLLNKLVNDRNVAVNEYKKAKASFDSDLSTLESRNEKDDVSALIEHKKKQEPKIHSYDEEIEKIRAEVEYFESEFDAVMSELNPTLKFDV